MPVHTALAPAGPWCKARAVMPAAIAASAEILVVADADVICEGIHASVQAVADGAPWAIPHHMVRRLTRDATTALLDGADPEGLNLEQRAYRGVEGGGIIVVPRRTLLDIPLDQRFTGWGQEDVSWAVALNCLAGAPWRGNADMLHLWHPAQPRQTRKVGSSSGQHLHRRYLAARRDPALMRALIAEGRDHDAHRPAVPARHDHAA